MTGVALSNVLGQENTPEMFPFDVTLMVFLYQLFQSPVHVPLPARPCRQRDPRGQQAARHHPAPELHQEAVTGAGMA
jgi:hypothetical protein